MPYRDAIEKVTYDSVREVLVHAAEYLRRGIAEQKTTAPWSGRRLCGGWKD